MSDYKYTPSAQDDAELSGPELADYLDWCASEQEDAADRERDMTPKMEV